MGDEHYPKLTIRVTPDLLHRLDALVPRLSKDRTTPATVRPNRASAARLALEIGLATIEARHDKGKPGTRQ